MMRDSKTILLIVSVLSLSVISIGLNQVHAKAISKEVLAVGRPLPNASLQGMDNSSVDLKNLKGKIKIISVVPQLNTPVCDKQTHRFSETNGGLDQHVDIITISTNSSEGQHRFSEKAKIHNITFLSDLPEYNFGKKTGLLVEGMGVLRRTVIVADENNVIRYVDFVPQGGLPNIEAALKAAEKLWNSSKVEK